jgi:uncharacterized protein YgiM (DUF1202 family)
MMHLLRILALSLVFIFMAEARSASFAPPQPEPTIDTAAPPVLATRPPIRFVAPRPVIAEPAATREPAPDTSQPLHHEPAETLVQSAVSIALIEMPQFGDDEEEDVAAMREVVVHTTALNLRDGPDPSFRAIGKIPQGSLLLVHDSLADGSWLDVEWQGIRGWVYAEYVE